VKSAIPAGVQFKVLDRVDWIPAAEHVVPLQQLMKDDPVKKTP
jgi:hypothetical protein